MELVKVPASRRDAAGKGAARRLRSDGRIPAVAYGNGEPAIQLAVSPKDLVGVLAREHGRNSVIALEVEGGSGLTVLLSDYQYHPVSRRLLHADFLKIALDQPVDVEVPFELTGKPAGVVLGGILRQVYRKLPVRCLPEKIPVKITHDVTALEIDDHVHTSDLGLPEGVSVRLPAEQTVAGVVTEKKRGYEEEEAAAGAAAAAGAPAAGATGAAAPAADAKPAKS
jgi:large subunit ribosomal protein L25